MDEVLYEVWSDEVGRGAVRDGYAPGVCVSVRERGEPFVGVCLQEFFPVLNAFNDWEVVLRGVSRCGGSNMFVFVERYGGALGACVQSVRRECAEWLSAPGAGAVGARKRGTR